MKLVFDKFAKPSKDIEKEVDKFLKDVETREQLNDAPIVVCQDGKSGSYYINCAIPAKNASEILDLNARLDPNDDNSYRANRELLTKHYTFQKMKADAEECREFNDIIVEYNTSYNPDKPLKVWGGQHRSKAIQEALNPKSTSRYHGFRVYFALSKKQRTELALISNTNIAVSNDLFDRQLEETFVGTQLREWCVKVGLLERGVDFPDQASKSEKISVKLARTFVVNFFKGKEDGKKLKLDELDRNIYEPYLCKSGVELDTEYDALVQNLGEKLWQDKDLEKTGRYFAQLHSAQRVAIEKWKAEKRKSFKNKALTASVIAGWSYVAGLLQSHPKRLEHLCIIPKPSKESPDPLNAKGMSTFHHEQDAATYRGLGTRSSILDRQRMAQVFLAKSSSANSRLDKNLLRQAVSQVIGIKVLKSGYTEI